MGEWGELAAPRLRAAPAGCAAFFRLRRFRRRGLSGLFGFGCLFGRSSRRSFAARVMIGRWAPARSAPFLTSAMARVVLGNQSQDA